MLSPTSFLMLSGHVAPPSTNVKDSSRFQLEGCGQTEGKPGREKDSRMKLRGLKIEKEG